MSGGEILLILIAVLVLLGADKMPGIARGIGRGMREFQKAADEIKSEFVNSTSEIRSEMNNIRSDIQDNMTKTGQSFTEAKDEIHSTVTDNGVKPESGKPDESYHIYEEAQKASASQTPVDEVKTEPDPKATDPHFPDIGANI